MEAKARIEEDLMPQRNCDAKDEMNLAEFPLCSLAHRLNPEVKTLRFEDRIWDKGRNQFIVRRLTITGSDVYGLPREKDDEVLLGLIQLTRARGFADRKVPFTRSELIRVLGWRDDSKSYARIEESLNRWTGVTLYYDNAWWNKDRKSWMKEAFHFLDNVWLCHRGEPPPDTGLPTTGMPQSAFVWNETVFRSFTHGNLKSVDFEFFKSLKSAVSKRLYRFLDKHFYKRNTFEMDLRELCCEHIGLSRNYDTANLKRKLMTGVTELEARGFLRPLSPEQRFTKVRPGEWDVRFERNPAAVTVLPPELDGKLTPIVDSLIQRGISEHRAVEIANTFPAERIHRQLDWFDSLRQKRDRKISRNAPGFLIAAIERDFKPASVVSPEKAATTLNARSPQQEPTPKMKTRSSDNLRLSHEQELIQEYWRSVPESERTELEALALASAGSFHRKVIDRGGPFADVARKLILDAFALRHCNTKSQSGQIKVS